MPVTLTSPALGHDVGFVYTGPEEPWLLAHGYARQNGYTGPGVSNTGAADTTPANDPTLAPNREPEPSRNELGEVDPGKPDPAMTFSTADDDPNDPPADPAYDFDAGGVNTEAPSDFTVDPATGPAGTVVTIEGQNLTGTTGVTFGGVAGTALDVVDDSTVRVTTGAHAAGAVDVVVTNANGSKTETGAFTYTA